MLIHIHATRYSDFKHCSVKCVFKMCILNVQIFFLLMFAGTGIQRSTANPTTSTVPNEITTTEDSLKHVSPVTVNEDPEHDLNCQPVSDHTRQQINLMMRMLGTNDSAVIAQTQMDLSDEAVLVLGEAGSGKTSLIQFLIGNSKLQANKIEQVSQHYLITDDGEKIGSAGNQHSFTQYPEIINFNSTINMIDTPGFHGSKSWADEIISVTVMKKILKKFKKLKILFLVENDEDIHPHSSPYLMNTLRHLNEFVDIGRYTDHIAFVFTKVPFSFIVSGSSDSNGNMITERKIAVGLQQDLIIRSIMDMLHIVESITADKLKSGKLSEQEKKFHQNVIGLLQSLKVKNNDGNPARVNLFHYPYMLGPLNNSDMTSLETDRQKLYKTIRNLKPAEIRQEDFNFTLSREAESFGSFKKCFKNLIFEEYKKKFTKMFCMGTTIPTYTKFLKTSNKAFVKAVNDVHSSHRTLSNLGMNLDDSYYNQIHKKVQEQVNCTGYNNQ